MESVATESKVSVPAATPLQRLLTYRLSALNTKLNYQATGLLAKVSGLTLSEWRVVSLLATHGEMNGARLAERSGIDRGQLSRTLFDLERQGFTVSRRSIDDRRNVLFDLTREGLGIHAGTLPHMQSRQKHLLGALSQQKRDLMFRIIDKLEIAAGATEFERGGG